MENIKKESKQSVSVIMFNNVIMIKQNFVLVLHITSSFIQSCHVLLFCSSRRRDRSYLVHITRLNQDITLTFRQLSVAIIRSEYR
jgi:hypothetical protein